MPESAVAAIRVEKHEKTLKISTVWRFRKTVPAWPLKYDYRAQAAVSHCGAMITGRKSDVLRLGFNFHASRFPQPKPDHPLKADLLIGQIPAIDHSESNYPSSPHRETPKIRRLKKLLETASLHDAL